MNNDDNDAPMTASGLYGKQNKLLHKSFETFGVAYTDDKRYWLDVISGVLKRIVTGLSDMSLGERSQMLSHLAIAGAKVYNPHVPRHWAAWKKGDPEPIGTVSRRPMHVPRDKYGMVRKIHAILADMRLPWSYVDEIARTRFEVEFVEWLRGEDLHKVVQMMVVHQKRHGGPGVRDRAQGGAA